MEKKNFTFIITTFKSEDIIDDCLKNLPVECKKIVVENSSNSKLKSNLEFKYKNLECFIMEQNVGYGKANNFGVKKSTTEYVFIINPDVILTSEKFEEIISNLRNISFSIAAPIVKDIKVNFDKKKILQVDYVRGYAMIIKREVALSIPFDENIFLYLEEIDFCKRAKSKNEKILLVNSEIKHLGGLSHGNRGDFEMEKSRNWHWMWSSFYYYKKHYGYFYSFLRTFPKFISSLIKCHYFLLKNEKKKSQIYKMRYLGLFQSYRLKESDYRPYNKFKKH